MEKKYKVSGTFLRQSINEMERIRTGAYSEAKHSKKKLLQEKADEHFEAYKAGKLDVNKDDLPTFAQYVDAFSKGNEKEQLLDKVQKAADFDVRDFLQKDSRSWWQKLLNKEKYELSASQMNRKIKKFVAAKQKLENSGYYSFAAARSVEKSCDEAEIFIDAYNKGDFSPNPADKDVFAEYVKTIGNFYEGSPAEKALKKLKESKSEPAKKQKHRSLLSFFKFKEVKYALGGVALTAVMSIGAWFGFGGNNKKQDAPKGKQPIVNIITKLSTPKMAMPEAFDYSLDKFIKTETANTLPDMQISASAGDDFYNSRISMFSSETKKKAMQKALAENLDKGIISLPQGISPSRFLYAKLIYQKYGFKDIAKEFDKALTADKALSVETQVKLYDYVGKAGAKGLGVRDMAYRHSYGKQNNVHKNLAQVMKENRANLR